MGHQKNHVASPTKSIPSGKGLYRRCFQMRLGGGGVSQHPSLAKSIALPQAKRETRPPSGMSSAGEDRHSGCRAHQQERLPVTSPGRGKGGTFEARGRPPIIGYSPEFRTLLNQWWIPGTRSAIRSQPSRHTNVGGHPGSPYGIPGGGYRSPGSIPKPTCTHSRPMHRPQRHLLDVGYIPDTFQSDG